MHENELQQIGLTEKEAKVYLSALTLGKATAQEVAKKADLKRPTTYFTIDLLMEKGLISSVHEGKKQFFMAENPERLVDVYHKREDDLRRQGEKLKKMIPDLKKMRPKGEEGPVVKYYAGKEGVMSMVRDLLSNTTDEQVWMAYPLSRIQEFLSPEEREDIKLVNRQKNVKIKALYTSSDVVQENTASSERRRIDQKLYPLEVDIAVYGTKVRFALIKDSAEGIVIDDADVAETIRTLLRLAWKGAEKST